MKYMLNDICFFVDEKIFLRKLTKNTYISTENMLPNRGGIVAASTLPSLSQIQSFKVGDVLVSNIRPYFKKVWQAEFDGGCSNDVLVFRANEGCDPTFLYYVLANDAFFNYATATSKGTKMPRGDKTAIMQYVVPNFGKDTQKRISGLLRCLDKQIATNKKINDNLEQQASALVGHYMQSIDTTVSIANIMSFDSGFPFQSSTYLPSGKYRIITIKNVQDGNIETSNTVFINNLPTRMKNNCILHVGDVLLSLTGNVGRVGIVCEENLLLNQRVAKIVPNDIGLLPLLYFIFRQPDIKLQMELIAKGTAQSNLSPVETLRLTIPFERKTAEALSRTLAPMYQTIISTTQESHSLSSLRDALLPKLMSGEIDVSEVEL